MTHANSTKEYRFTEITLSVMEGYEQKQDFFYFQKL